MHTEFLLLLLAIGGVGGFLSGLLGVGGGIVFVPALYMCFTAFGIAADHAIRVAIGTSSALVLVTGATSAFWHHKKGSIDFSILKSWSVYVVAGVAVGTFFASYVNGHFLKLFFASAALLIAVYMAVSKEPEPSATPQPHRVSPQIQRMVAALIGAFSSMIGVGGAMLNVPFMAYIGVPMRKSVGTGGALGFIIALPAMAGYIISGLHAPGLPPYSFGYVNLIALAVIIPLSMLLSPVGVHVSHTTQRYILRRIFAAVLVVVAVRMFMTV